MSCEHQTHDHTLEHSRLYHEATAVGLLLVPMWWAVSKATTAVKIGGTVKPFVDVAVAGFLFHLAAEETGVNAWYLTHSYAAQKVLHPRKRDDLLHCVAAHWNSSSLDRYGALYAGWSR